jgi:NADH-quinone oxidoreductase subunit L
LCSYLLIGFWYDKGKEGIANAIAAKKAFVTNRIGDFGFLIAAIFLIFWNFGVFRISMPGV